MAQDMFSRWDKEIDTEGLQNDIAEAATNGGNGTYKEVPHGNYEVAVQQMELKASKKGDPMVSIWFKIVSDGDYKKFLHSITVKITLLCSKCSTGYRHTGFVPVGIRSRSTER